MRYFFLLFLLLFSLASFGQDDEVYLLVNRAEARKLRHALILEEKREIRYGTFIFALDEMGKSVVGLFADAAMRGVKVKLIIDGMGESKGLVNNHAILAALQKWGVDIRVFNPIIRHPLSLNYRNHQKELVTSIKMIVGGRNSQSHYFDDYIDTEILVKGNQVRTATEHFDILFNSPEIKEPWLFVTDEEIAIAQAEIKKWRKEALAKSYQIRKLEYTKVEDAQYHADHPNIKMKRENGINKQIIAMIERAEKELSFLNPYVYLSDDVKQALERAIKRGVKIRIATNSKATTDSVIGGIAWEVRKHELLEMGIEVYESDRYIHSKTIVRDGTEIFVGSFNLDVRSYNLNLENGIFFKNKKLATVMNNYHRRLTNFFMKKMDPKVEVKLKPGIKSTALCIRKGYHKLLTKLAWPHL